MNDPTPPPERSRRTVTISSLLLAVASTGAMLALVVRARQAYASVPSFAAPAHPQHIAIPAVVLWVLLGSIATWAWRHGSPDRLMTQILISALLVYSRMAVPGAGIYRMLWPAACFGFGVAAPLLIRRYTSGGPHSARVESGSLVVIDSAATALLVLVFADFIPKR